MALPAAFFIRRFSYKGAIMVGFLFYALGALLAIPASLYAVFPLFLLGSYVITFGLAFLETACNPYILSMGPKETATQRLNLAQAFNPIGSLMGMFVASQLLAPNLMVTQLASDLKDDKQEVVQYLVQNEADIPAGAVMKLVEKIDSEGKVLKDPKTGEAILVESKPGNRTFILNDEAKTEVKLYDTGIPDYENELGALEGASTNALKVMRETDPTEFEKLQQADLGYVRTPYVILAGVVLVFLAIFAFSKMPSFHDETVTEAPFLEITGRIWKRPRFVGGVIAQLFNIGAQIMCWTYVVHYGMRYVGLTLAEAQMYNIYAMIIMLFMFAMGGVAFTIGAIYLPSTSGLISLVMISACLSLMFPTIYGIALNGMEEEEAKLGSAYLIMAIVGGAVLTKLQGGMINDVDVNSIRTSFWLPAGCFMIVALYGLFTLAVLEPKAKREKLVG